MSSEKPRLKMKYEVEISNALKKELALQNAMQIPRLKSIVLNVGLGEAVQTPKLVESSVRDITAITGQKPVITRARKAIAGFKLREGVPIGVMVTLRRDKMWEFADRLFTFALPRVRDFKGTNPKSFDGRGNYTLGVKEHIIFPEINYDKVEKIKGMNITFVTTARSDAEGRALLTALGMPFRR